MASSNSVASQKWQAYLEEAQQCHLPGIGEPGLAQFGFFEVEAACSQQLRQKAVAEDASFLPAVLHAAWAVVLSCYTGKEEVCFGFGKATTELKESTYVQDWQLVRASLTGTMSLAEISGAAKDQHKDFLQYAENQGNGDITTLHLGRKDMCNSTILLWEGCSPETVKQGRKVPNKILSQLKTSINFYVHILVTEHNLNVYIECAEDAASTFRARSLGATFDQVLSQLIRHPQTLLADTDCFSRHDMAQVLDWNSNDLSHIERCVHDVIQDQISLRPQAEAVCAWDGSFSYAELSEASTKLATYLVELGVGPGVFVPVCFDKCKFVIVSMVAILKAGAAFVPLDPQNPIDRLRSLANKVDARILLCSKNHVAMLDGIAERIIPIDSDMLQGLSPVTAPLNQRATPYDPAYMIFTSGSTGEPKAAVIEHHAILSSAEVHAPKMQIDSESRVLHFAACTWDVSIVETITTLTRGGCVCIPSEHARLNNLEEAINSMRVTWSLLTPTVAKLIDPADIPGLQVLALGGEAMTEGLIQAWRHRTLMNVYGPAECSVVSHVNAAMTPGTSPFCLGGHIGVHAWIVDKSNHDRLVPIGSIGELVVEGFTLGRGYHKEKEKTAAAWISDPLWTRVQPPVGRKRCMYKSGDLVRYNADGSFEFIGRKDTQIKFHGQRIELGEVEHNVNRHERIRHGMVVLPKTGFCQGRLVTVIQIANEAGLDLVPNGRPLQLFEGDLRSSADSMVSSMRNILADKLPIYMIPSMWIVVEYIPLLQSGKLDRRRVSTWVAEMSDEIYRSLNPSSEAIATDGRSATQTESDIRDIWAHVLNLRVNQIGLQQAFLSLGGDSISAMQVMGRCRKKGIGLTVHQILRSSSISHLALQVKELKTQTTYREIVGQPFDLSPIQRVYFARQEHAAGHYNQSFLLHAKTDIKNSQIQSAIQAVIKRHSMLRARFARTGKEGEWQQYVTNEIESSYRLRNWSVNRRDEIVDRLAESQTCLNIEIGPMFAADLVQVKDDGMQLLFMVGHHLVIDLVSWRVILQDIEDLLRDPQSTCEDSLPFQTWCHLQEEHSKTMTPTQALPLPDLPSGNSEYWGMKNRSHVYGDMKNEGFEVPSDITTLLLTKCHHALRTEIPDILIAALIFGFGQAFTDRSLPPVFAEGHGREAWDSEIDLTRTVGWFTTIYPVYVDLDGNESLTDVIRFVKDMRRKVPGKGRPYFASRWLTPEGQQAFSRHWPLEIAFNYLGQYQQLEREGALLTPAAAIAGETRGAGGAADVGRGAPAIALIEISAVIIQGALRFSFAFNRQMEHQDGMLRWIANCKDNVCSAVQNLTIMERELTLGDFPLLQMTYSGLESFKTEKLRKVGIHSLEMVEDAYPCSPMQQGLLVSKTKDEDDLVYAAHTFHEVKAKNAVRVDAERLGAAWQKVVDRHPMLRTIFVESASERDALHDQVVLKRVDANMVRLHCDTDEEVTGLLDTKPVMDYDDGTRPLHRFTICTTVEGKVYTKLEISHAIMDGTSLSIIFRDLVLAYEGKLPERGPLYSEYIAYLSQQPVEPAVVYWRDYLRDVEPSHFPVLNDGHSSSRQLKCVRVSFEDLQRLQKFCDSQGLTFANAIHTAWALTLRCYTGSEDVCFGYITSARDAPIEGAQDAVGPLINMLACRVALPASVKIKEIMSQIQQDYLDSLQYRHLPLAEVQHALQLSGVSLFNTALSYRKLPRPATETPEISFVECIPTYDPDEYNVSINIEAGEQNMAIDLAYWTDCLSEGQAQNVASTFTQSLRNILENSQRAICEIDDISSRNLGEISTWNSTIPKTLDLCVHQVFQEQVSISPQAPAICSWDGDYTYEELDRISSRLAQHLFTLGVHAETFVLICFNKSAFAIIAMLAVLKAGGACVPLDPTHPKSALELRASDTRAEFVLAAPQCANTFEGMVRNIVVIEPDFLAQLPDLTQSLHTSVTSQNACFIIYTSGSTGKPKGVVLEHRGITTSAKAHGPLLGYTPQSRVLQFASYTFDNSLAEMFTTLMSGGCVCVPSDHDRLNNLVNAVNSLKVNLADITPTVATFIQPSEVPTLKRLALGGEAVTKRVVDIWSESVSMHACYGPSECSINCAYSGDIAKPGKATNIGKACGCVLWIVDPSNHNKLAAVGSPGELLVEGPIVSRGYLHDPEKSAKAFIESPDWAKRLVPKGSLPNRRMYKTGDLVRYDSDGSIMYLGRKDTQVKLNGQRIELGEIEHHLEKRLSEEAQSAVELAILGKGQTNKKALTAFLCLQSDGTVPDATEDNESILPMSESIQIAAKDLEIALSAVVPSYMVPTAWLPIRRMPLTSSGKLNRRQLRNMAASIADDQVASYRLASKSGRAPATDTEKILAGLWELILTLEPKSVGAEDNFFKLGGDSIGAMRLVTAARAQEITLTVASVFQKATLVAMADAATGAGVLQSSPITVEPFSLLERQISQTGLLKMVTPLCDIDQNLIQDIYPCTAIQEGMMALSVKEPGAYVAQMVYRLPSNIDLNKFRSAWESVSEVEAVLRTRIVFTEALGFLQVVTKIQVQWHSVSNLEGLVEEDRQLSAADGGELIRYAIVGEGTNSPYFVLTIHHALYDGWCLPLILDKVKAAYYSPETPTTGPQYSTFIRYVSEVGSLLSDDFWRSRLAGVASVQFPRLPNPGYQARASSMMSHVTTASRKKGSELTMASFIRAAWAMTIATYSGSNDVVFNETVTGRDAPVVGLEDMIGATLATVPTRVAIEKTSSICDFLKRVQNHSAETMPYQYAGLQHIKRLSEDAAIACESQNLIAINNGDKEQVDSFWNPQNDTMAGTNFYTYPMMLSCFVGKFNVEVDCHYDQDVMPSWQMERLLHQFGFILGQLVENESSTIPVGQLDKLGPADIDTIASWNSQALPVVDRCIHEIIQEHAMIFEENKAAVCAWDISMTFKQLDSLSSRLARVLHRQGIGRGSIIPLCFDKSGYTMVAMLGVLKTGAAFVSLSPDQPKSRLQDILTDVDAKTILCSPKHAAFCWDIVPHVLPIDSQMLAMTPSLEDTLPVCYTNSPAYVIFTSGTTGKPKGTVVDHAAFSTSAAAHGSAMQITKDSRVLQFASYTFDASIMEIFTTLLCGGCVCVPDEESRLNDITKVINDMEVSWTLLTPSFVQTIQPSSIPGLQTLVLGGEAMSQSHISTWAGHVRLMNAFGPSETAVVATVNSQVTLKAGPANIGRAVGSKCWITDPEDHNILVPIGVTGELLIEGPILAQGYLNNAQKTSEAFLVDPQWTQRFNDSVAGVRRFYKTGDLVKYAADGTFVFIGRKDNQVKVHGQRMELGEVEHHLNTDNVIRHALACMPSKGHCSKRLVAVLSLQADQEVVPSEDLLAVARNVAAFYLPGIRDRISGLLPLYMVPSTWVILHHLPMLPSGKLDRRRVLEFVDQMSEDLYRQVSDAEAAASTLNREATAIEKSLQSIFARVLNLEAEKVPLNQSFLRLGGDSISAMQVMAQARSKSLGLSVRDIIQSKSICELAEKTTVPKETSYKAEEVEKSFSLSPIQQVYFDLVGDNWSQFNQSMLVLVKHHVDSKRVEEAVYEIVNAHSMLRSRFSKDKAGVWQQQITSKVLSSYRFETHPFNGMEQAATVIESSQKSLDIIHGPLLAVDLFESPSGQQRIFLVAHHLIIDVVSWRIIMQDLESALQSITSPKASLPFQTWCHLQASRAQDETADKVIPRGFEIPAADFAYWGMSDEPNLHGDAVEQTFELSSQETLQLMTNCYQALNTDPVEIFIAALMSSFSKVFVDRVSVPAIYNEGHGREPWDGIDISQTVGWFTTMCPIYIPRSSELQNGIFNLVRWIKDFRRRVPDKGRPYFAYRELTTDGKARFGNNWPIEITFNYLGQMQQLERADSLLQPVDTVEQINSKSDVGPSVPRFCLFEIGAILTGGTLKFSFTYSRRMQRQPDIQLWIRECQVSLRTAIEELGHAKSGPTLADYPLLPLTYEGLQPLHEKLPLLGVSSLEEIEDIYPCSPIQNGILLSQLRDPLNYAYHTIFEVQSTNSGVDVRKLSNAWQAVVNRHSSLRTVFVDGISEPGVTVQVVLEHYTAQISWIENKNQDVLKVFGEQAAIDYSLLLPPHRLTVFQAHDARIFCKLEMSHAISDGTSMPLLLQDLSRAYEAGSLSRGPNFGDYMQYVQSRRSDSDMNYWKAYLSDIEPCAFPSLTDGMVTARQLRSFDFDLPLADDIQKFCTANGITLSSVMQLTWGLLLRRYTGSDDVCFGYLVSGRDVPVDNIQQAVGVFINMLTCRMRLPAMTTLESALQQAQTDIANGLAHQTISLADLQHELKIGSGLFNTAFTFQKRAGSAELENNALKYNFLESCDPSEYQITLNVEATDSTIGLSFTYWSDTISDSQMQGIGSVFQHVLKSIVATATQNSTIGNIDYLSEYSIQRLNLWNNKSLPRVERCVHEVFQEHARTRPLQTPAVDGWDGSYTYTELDTISTHLAQHLKSLGLQTEDFVPLCFEKSVFTILAMIAVMKAGGAFVPVSPEVPESRLRYLLENVSAKLVLCSSANESRIAATGCQTFVVSDHSLKALLQQPTSSPVAKVEPTNLAYAIFTSGTTGAPKGTLIEHGAFCTGATEHGAAMLMRQDSRVLQFASYTFDASVMEILSTLIIGGCVCVPTDQERMNDIPGIIRRMGVTWTLLTPSVASVLKPGSVPSLKVLVTGGEAMSPGHITKWKGTGLALINAYGPSECSVVATTHVKVDENGQEMNSEPANIGHAVGGRCWVIDPDNHDQLVPIGAIGELCVEGRIAARSYLNNPQKTAAAFLTEPLWSKSEALRNIFVSQERMYKTGDLVRCNSDGSFNYIGRKDTQIKLNGQRIEVAEIEYHVKQSLPENSQAAVDLVAPSGARKTLAAFFSVESGVLDTTMSEVDEILLPMNTEINNLARNIEATLGNVLPAYMIPSIYIPLTRMPWTASGKLDRTRLRNIVHTISKEDAVMYKLGGAVKKRLPKTEMEKKLQSFWATALDVATDSIGVDDSFFRIGGDSVSAMKLVSIAGAAQIALTVVNVFRKPKLCEMAKACTSLRAGTQSAPKAFSLLGTFNPSFVNELASICRIDATSIQDAYPCSSLQEGLLTLSIKQAGAYIAKNIFRLPPSINEARLKVAWQQTVDELDILRTRIAHTASGSFVQTVMKHEEISWNASKTLQEIPEVPNLPAYNGGPLAEYTIVSGSGKVRYLVWCIHHALYDGWSMPLLLKRVQANYSQSNPSQNITQISYATFMQYLAQSSKDRPDEFWRTRLSGASSVLHFPAFNPAAADQTIHSQKATHTARVARDFAQTGVTLPVIIRAAWAVVLSRYTASNDVAFGETLAGRDVPVHGITGLIGPTLTTVPQRFQIDEHMGILNFLQVVQQSSTDLIPYQHVGLQQIRQLGSDAAAACDFQNLLVIQTAEESINTDMWQQADSGVGDNFFTYPLVLECTIGQAQIEMDVHHDTNAIDAWQVQRLLYQFDAVLKQMSRAHQTTATKLGEIEVISPQDMQILRDWNYNEPTIVDECIHKLFMQQVRRQPDAEAVCAWDKTFTYRELFKLSAALARHLLTLNAGPEKFIPVVLEKSAYSIVSVMGILLSGAAFIPLDPAHPISRHFEIISDTKATILLSPPKYSASYESCVQNVLVIDEESIQRLPNASEATLLSPVKTTNAAYAIYTSGSTGKPKGVVVEHRAFCSSSQAFRRAMLMKPTSRVLQFASMTFDASVMEVFTTLTYGGCVCVPSEEEKIRNTAGVITELNVTWTFITPSVANIIEPSSVPCLEVLVCGGEAMSRETVKKWADCLTLVNGYGPTECSVISVANSRVSKDKDPTNIGRMHEAGFAWITEAFNHNRLAPLGAVGELLIEGPLLAREYMNDKEKTAAAFIQDPAWTKNLDGRSHRMYKTGDLVRYHHDGSIIYIGRKDNQVKLHGQRMELGEIEHRLELYPQVKHAIVCMPKSGLCSKRLVAAISVSDLAEAPAVLAITKCELITTGPRLESARAKVAEAQDRLREELPAYMVPTVWTIVESIPVLVSGKLDRKQVVGWIENMDDTTYDSIMSGEKSSEPEQTQNETAKTLRRIWSEAFDSPPESIRYNDSFLSLGGNSISAMQIMAKCRKEGLNPSLQDVLRSKSITHLASLLGDSVTSSTEIIPAEVLEASFELSPVQRLYFEHIDLQGVSQFNQSYLLQLTSFVERNKIEQALKTIVERHSMLRARFIQTSNGWVQRITEQTETSYRFNSHQVDDKKAMIPAISVSQAGMNITHGPLLACDLFQFDGKRNQQGLFIAIHHLVVDAVSWLVILQDLETLLGARSSESLNKPLSFQTWCNIQASAAQKASIEDVQKLLPSSVAPTQFDYWNMSERTNVYGDTETMSFAIDEALTAQALGDCHKALRTEPIDLFISAVAQSFSKVFTDRTTPTIFNESHGREWDSTLDLSGTVGWFTTISPIHVAASYDTDLIDLVKTVKDTRRKLGDNGRSYFAHRYLTASGRSHFKDHMPMEILFNYLGNMGSVGRQDSLLKNMEYSADPEVYSKVSDVGAQTKRLALFEISAGVSEGKIQFSFMFNQHVKYLSSVKIWVQRCKGTLEDTISRLIRTQYQPTLTDFPLLPISYAELQKLTVRSFTTAGIKSLAQVEDVYPVSSVQEGVLLSQVKDKSSYIFYSISEVVTTQPNTTVDARHLLQAWQKVVDRHASLRTVFIDSVYKGGVFDQVVLSEAPSGALIIECGESEVLDRLGEIKIENHNHHRLPKLPHQFTVCETSSGKVFMKMEINHAVIDGASCDNIIRDLALAYEGKLSDVPGPLYSDYIAFVRKQSPSAGISYFKAYLNDLRPSIFPTLTSDTQRVLGSLKLSFNNYAGLQSVCKKYNVTLSNVMHAAWALILRTYTGSNDVSFGYLTAGRDAPVKGIQDAVGAFINMLICRIQLTPSLTLDSIFSKVQNDYLETLPYQHISLARIQHELGLPGKSLFNTALSIQGGSSNETEQHMLSFNTMAAYDPNEYSVTLNINVTPGEEAVLFRYWKNVISDQQAETLSVKLSKVLESIVNEPSSTVADVDYIIRPPQPSQPSQNLQSTGEMKHMIAECVREVIEQMFKSGALVRYNANGDADRDVKNNHGHVQVLKSDNEKALTHIAAEIAATRPTEAMQKANQIIQRVAELKPKIVIDHVEATLRTLWSEALNITEDSIHNDSSFFELGGDSITAMVMAGSAREAGLSLTVADVFHNPGFEEMIQATQAFDSSEGSLGSTSFSPSASREVITYKINKVAYEPFSLLDIENISGFLQDHVCHQINVFRGGISDVMPVSDFQSLAITGSLLESRWMLNYFYLDGSGEVDLRKLKQAVSKMTQMHDILRTVFIPYEDKFLQVVLRQLDPEFNVCETETSLEDFTNQLRETDILFGPQLGQSSLQFTLVKLKGTSNHRIVLRMNHAQYDGIGFARILSMMQDGYEGNQLQMASSYSTFINHSIGRATTAHYDYWKKLLHGSLMTEIVHRQKPNYNQAGGNTMTYTDTIKLPSLAAHNITDATVIKAAWALVIAELAAQSDVTFAQLVNGRASPVDGIESLLGPCLNLAPVRVMFQPYWTVLDLMRHVQDQQVASMPYESLGFREIIKHCTDWPNWTNFTTCVQHQNLGQHKNLRIGDIDYRVGVLGSQENFADIEVVTTPMGNGEMQIAVIYNGDGQVPHEFAQKAHKMLCETVENFYENPHLTLLNPKKLTGMPCQTLPEPDAREDVSVIHATDNLSEAKLQALFDIIRPLWATVLPKTQKKDHATTTPGQASESLQINFDSDFFSLGGDITGLALISVRLKEQDFAVSIEDLVDNPTMRDQMGLVALQHYGNDDDDDGGSDSDTLADEELRVRNVKSMETMLKKGWGFVGKMMGGRKKSVRQLFGGSGRPRSEAVATGAN